MNAVQRMVRRVAAPPCDPGISTRIIHLGRPLY